MISLLLIGSFFFSNLAFMGGFDSLTACLETHFRYRNHVWNVEAISISFSKSYLKREKSHPKHAIKIA